MDGQVCHLNSIFRKLFNSVNVCDDGIVKGLNQDVPVTTVHDLQLDSQWLETDAEAVQFFLGAWQLSNFLSLCF